MDRYCYIILAPLDNGGLKVSDHIIVLVYSSRIQIFKIKVFVLAVLESAIFDKFLKYPKINNVSKLLALFDIGIMFILYKNG